MTSKYGVISKILLVVFLMTVSSSAFAQSMTDNQVIQFVLQEQQKGSDQQTIVTKLLQKGVTAEQLRRIRKKYEAQKTQMGAVDLQDQDITTNNTANRMRTNKEKALEKLNQQNGYMIRSQREEMEEKLKSRTDRQSTIRIFFVMRVRYSDEIFSTTSSLLSSLTRIWQHLPTIVWVPVIW